MEELCRKFGEKLLAEIITILHTSSLSNDDRTREGVCMALYEILSVAFPVVSCTLIVGLQGEQYRESTRRT
jgi:hypothetical protein